MKIVFFALLSLFVIATTVPAHAIPVSRDQANEYFAYCMKNGKKAAPEAFGSLCACTSARVMTVITAEELAASSQKTPEGQAAQRKILTDVFANDALVVLRIRPNRIAERSPGCWLKITPDAK